MFLLVFLVAIDLSGARMKLAKKRYCVFYKEKTGHKGLELSTCLILIRIRSILKCFAVLLVL
jgi:hypothetical protein